MSACELQVSPLPHTTDAPTRLLFTVIDVSVPTIPSVGVSLASLYQVRGGWGVDGGDFCVLQASQKDNIMLSAIKHTCCAGVITLPVVARAYSNSFVQMRNLLHTSTLPRLSGPRSEILGPMESSFLRRQTARSIP